MTQYQEIFSEEEERRWNPLEDVTEAVPDLEMNERYDLQNPVCIAGPVIEVGNTEFNGELSPYAVIDDEKGEKQTPNHFGIKGKVKRLKEGDNVQICLIGLKEVGQKSLMGIYKVIKAIEE